MPGCWGSGPPRPPNPNLDLTYSYTPYCRAQVPEVIHAMESDRPRRSGLACGRPGGAPSQHRGMAAGPVVPVGVRATRALLLDAVPVGGHLEIVVVHPGRADPGRRPVPVPRRAPGVSALELPHLRRRAAAVARLRGEVVRAGREAWSRRLVRCAAVRRRPDGRWSGWCSPSWRSNSWG